MWKVNKKGRSYPLGKALSLERRVNIVDEIQSKGGVWWPRTANTKKLFIFYNLFVANKFSIVFCFNLILFIIKKHFILENKIFLKYFNKIFYR